MKRISFVLITSLVILALFGCSSGSNAVTPDPGDGYFPVAAASSTVNAHGHVGGSDVAGVDAFLFDLEDRTLISQTITNGLGIAQFGVEEGQYLLVLFTDTLYAEPVSVNAVKDSVIDLNVELVKPIYSTTALYFGFVSNEDNNTAIPWCEVSIGDIMTYSDGYGFYMFEAPAESSKITAARNGFDSKTIDMREGQFADRNDYYNFDFFSLKSNDPTGTTLRGFIREASFGGELGGAFVSLIALQQEGQPIITFMTNVDGRYNFFNLELGQYTVAVRRDGYEAESNQVIINDNEAIFNVYLLPDFNERGSLQGYVLTPAGNGIGNAQVVITNPLLGKYVTMTDPATGFYFVDEIIPGDYTILALPPGTLYEPATTFVTMTDEDLIVSISCPSPLTGALTGIISIAGQDPDALPPTGAKVVAEKIGSPFSGLTWTTHADKDGRYTINGIYTGLYRIEATLDYDDEVNYAGLADQVPVAKGLVTETNIEMN